MQILHVIRSLDPAHGGPPGVVARLAASQARLGHRVTVLSYASHGREAAIGKALARVPNLHLCRLDYVEPSGVAESLFAGRARDAAVRGSLFHGCDFVHLHGVWDTILRGVATEARRHAVPYAVRPAGTLDPWSLRQRRWKKRVALALVVRRMLNGAAFLHALNSDEAQLFAPLRLRVPVEIVPNGVFVEEIEPLPPRGTFRATQPALGRRPFILFLGRLHYKKGLDYVADAFAAIAPWLPEVMLVVAGPDGGAQRGFEERVTAAGLRDRVLLVGPLYGEEKLAALADAACFCLPSRQEGFSVAITEAMACHVPVVVSRACHFPEVADAGAGEVVDLCPEAVAAALTRVMSDELLRARMGRAGRELVISRFTWPRVAERLTDAYLRRGRPAAFRQPEGLDRDPAQEEAFLDAGRLRSTAPVA